MSPHSRLQMGVFPIYCMVVNLKLALVCLWRDVNTTNTNTHREETNFAWVFENEIIAGHNNMWLMSCISVQTYSNEYKI